VRLGRARLATGLVQPTASTESSDGVGVPHRIASVPARERSED
jgi:hypothetical protein